MSMETTAPTELRTGRLLLRPPRMADADELFAVYGDPEFAHFGFGGPISREGVTRRLARITARPWGDGPEFSVVLEGRVVGSVRLGLDRANQTADLGYGIAREYWGKGLATEAARAAVDHAFAAFGLAKVWARADPRNAASVRVLEKLGMRREGLLRSHVVRWGERADRAYYGLLRAEWEAQGVGAPRQDATVGDANTGP